MAVAQISILSKDEIELVHEKTLMILENPGIMVMSDRALDILEGGGARIDRKRQVASLPESLVKETVKRLPKEVKLCARNPKQDMLAPRDGPPYMATNGTAVYMAELGSGAQRPTLGKALT